MQTTLPGKSNYPTLRLSEEPSTLIFHGRSKSAGSFYPPEMRHLRLQEKVGEGQGSNDSHEPLTFDGFLENLEKRLEKTDENLERLAIRLDSHPSGEISSECKVPEKLLLKLHRPREDSTPPPTSKENLGIAEMRYQLGLSNERAKSAVSRQKSQNSNSSGPQTDYRQAYFDLRSKYKKLLGSVGGKTMSLKTLNPEDSKSVKKSLGSTEAFLKIQRTRPKAEESLQNDRLRMRPAVNARSVFEYSNCNEVVKRRVHEIISRFSQY